MASLLKGLVLATSMAVSGTIILFLCRQKLVLGQNSSTPSRNLRSCIAAHEKKREKKKKRVHFADELVVIEPIRRDNEKIRREESLVSDGHVPKMPANRMALYNGILQDRLQRMACS